MYMDMPTSDGIYASLECLECWECLECSQSWECFQCWACCFHVCNVCVENRIHSFYKGIYFKDDTISAQKTFRMLNAHITSKGDLHESGKLRYE